MPMERNGRLPNANGELSIHAPGSYRYVLQNHCERELFDVDVALSDITGDELAAHERSYRARVMALVDQVLAAGEPLACQSWEMPGQLGAAFTRWPRDGQQHAYRVYADDTVTLTPREART
jgi:hypothetical protein